MSVCPSILPSACLPACLILAMSKQLTVCSFNVVCWDEVKCFQAIWNKQPLSDLLPWSATCPSISLECAWILVSDSLSDHLFVLSCVSPSFQHDVHQCDVWVWWVGGWLISTDLLYFVCVHLLDIRERFHYAVLLSIVLLRNMAELDWNEGENFI